MPRGVPRAVQRRFVYAALLSISASTSYAQDSNSLDCSKPLKVDDVAYDLSSLAGERTLKRTRETPPSTMEDELRFNICQDLAHRDEVADEDQCSTGTRACLIKTNKKSGTDERVVAAIPIAQTSTLNLTTTALQSPAGLSLTLHGPPYPPSAPPSAPQSLNLTLLCSQDGTSSPSFVGYENGVVSVEWKTSAGCPAKQNDGGNGGDGNEGDDTKPEEGHSTGGSGIGWFFLFLFLAFVGYFALGAYYNYNNFGATGWDLVPHRDFWRDVPYLVRDFTEHLCSTLRPGRQGGSRRGYMAV